MKTENLWWLCIHTGRLHSYYITHKILLRHLGLSVKEIREASYLDLGELIPEYPWDHKVATEEDTAPTGRQDVTIAFQSPKTAPRPKRQVTLRMYKIPAFQ